MFNMNHINKFYGMADCGRQVNRETMHEITSAYVRTDRDRGC